MSFVYAGQYGPASTDNTLNQLLADTPFLVYFYGTTNQATLYTNQLKVETLTQPAYTDGRGNMTFFCDPGRYDVSCNSVTLTVPVYADPAEPIVAEGTEPTNIDGGASATVYTSEQNVDGGSASSVFDGLGIDGETRVAIRIQCRHDTAENFTADNPTLMPGERGFETDTGKAKTGNGINSWTTLGYEGPFSGGVIITAQGGASYTLQAADANTEIEFTSVAGCVVTVPFYENVPFPKGTVIGLVQMGAGTVAVGGGPTVLSPYSTSTNVQYSAIFLTNDGVDTWRLSGDLSSS